MAYQGGNTHGEGGHDLQQYPPSTYHMPPARDYDSDEEQERVPLTTQQPRASPFEGPFDERGGQAGQRPPPGGGGGYSLTESYGPSPAPSYTEGNFDPNNPYPRVASPYARTETSSTEAWRQRQAPAGLRRYATRKIKLVQGQALSIDHPVPSAIQNAVQAKYRTPEMEGGSEEFTHMRCKSIYHLACCCYY